MNNFPIREWITLQISIIWITQNSIRNAYKVMLKDRKVLSFCESSFVTRTFANVDRGVLFATTAIKVLLSDNRWKSLPNQMKISS